jgi:site-specific DNA recombinase
MRLLAVQRISHDKETSSSLDKQDRVLRQWAEASGHEIVAAASDRDVSGRTDPMGRPELGPWLTDPQKRAQYDGIAAYALDRLARSVRYFHELLAWAEEHDKHLIITSMGNLDFRSPVGQLIGGIIAWLAQEELRLVIERTAATRRYLIENDYLVGTPPYGYKVVPAPDGSGHKVLAVDTPKAGKLKEAVAGYLEQGWSLRTVASHLDVPVSSAAKIFRSTTLIGRRKNAAGQTVLRMEPVLDRPTWNRLQAELDRKASRKGVVNSATTALLTGVAQCWYCGRGMGRHKSKGRFYYYRCNGTSNDPSTCRNMVQIEWLDGEVDKFMRGNFGRVNSTTEVITIEGSSDYSDEIAEVEQDLHELDFDDPDFAGKQAALLTERKRLRELPSVPDQVLEVSTGQRVSEWWDSAGSAERRAYLLEHGIRARARRGECEVTFTRRARVSIERSDAEGLAPALHIRVDSDPEQ